MGHAPRFRKLVEAPPAPLRTFNRTMHLSRLQELADLIVAEDELPEKTAATDRADLTQIQACPTGNLTGGRRERCESGGRWRCDLSRKSDSRAPNPMPEARARQHVAKRFSSLQTPLPFFRGCKICPFARASKWRVSTMVARGNTIKSSHSDDSRPASSSHGRVGRGDL